MGKKLALLFLAFVFLSSSLWSGETALAASKTTQYRVYQNDKPLKEFATQNQAITYAKSYQYSHVEKISNREWIWDNFPKFKVYVNGQSSTSYEFATLDEAKTFASKQPNSYVRQLDNVGWAYEKLANYVVYQGDKTKDSWKFSTLAEAKKEAAKWKNSHIIDLSNSKWIWDNISSEERVSLKASDPIYEIHVNGEKAANSRTYGFFKEAIMAANELGNATVYNSKDERYVFINESFDLYNQGKWVDSFTSVDEAVKNAKSYSLAEVKQGEALYWSNIPYLSVYQGERLVKSFHTLKSALSYAKSLSNSFVQNAEGRKLWSFAKPFIVLGWNGSSNAQTIHNHIANTQGLNIDSPTWYYLENENGDLNDSSNAALVAEYAELGIDIIPLVHNQFDKNITSAFLKNEQAQDKFIQSLVTSLKNIKAKGMNLDFEEMLAADRDNYTNFVKKLSEAIHNAGMTISIDLLRGDKAWNDRTVYDREALAKYVDYVIIMAYDQHWSGSETAGSVAGIDWVEEGIKQYLEYGIERSKLILGIPFYVRQWRIDANGSLVDNKAVLMKDIDKVIADNKATVTFDEKYGQNKVTYVKDGYTHVFWAETVATVKQRVELAKKYDLAGIAAWRLGYEQPEVWDVILQAKEL